jgi:DNA-binding response OmpR family regulator
MATKVLIIDDDPLLREVAVELLAEAGHDCAIAEDGRLGIASLEARPVELVLLDMIMPNMDGVETLGQIKARWPELPVVVMSAGTRSMAMQSLLRLAASLGADEVMQKPLRRDVLLPLVERLLGRATKAA